MAQIRLEVALETSNKWNITSVPLLRWQSKLKRATQECDHTLRRCRQRLQEEEEVKQGLWSSSFPKRVTQTAMSFVSSMFSGGNNDELGEIMMPKAVDCHRRNVAATLYQMLWKSKHGSAFIRVEKTSWRESTRKDKVGKCCKQRSEKKVPVQGWTSGNNEFIGSWIEHVPALLQGSVVDYWFQKEKRSTLPLLFKTNGCTHDCPIMLSSLQDHRYLARKLKLSCTFKP
ncbi:unnamed protein product [Miscanthus lutarioriparius]|uniref:Uncharacterized protein n=1 Tax=Miscanthus lutarioriparius TaxID=422564 RepID=A0A811QBG1_9POAL|nr:unnamed protein product [Miscanthus lutarioriparius]